MKKPRPTYRTVLEDVRDLEVKYRKINEEAEKSRTRTELDYLRPDNYLQSPHWESSENKIIKEDIPYDKYHRKKIENFHDTAVNINKEVRTATPRQNYNRPTTTHSYQRTRNTYLGSDFPSRYDGPKPSRVIEANRCDYNERREIMLSNCLGEGEPGQQRPRRQEEGGGLRRRFTNRENRLARQLLE